MAGWGKIGENEEKLTTIQIIFLDGWSQEKLRQKNLKTCKLYGFLHVVDDTFLVRKS